MSTTPPPAAPPPAAAPGGSSGIAIGPPQIISLAGAAAVLISGWLNWGDFEGETASAYEIGSEILFDSSFSLEEGKGLLGIGYLVLLCAALIVVGTLVRSVRFLSIVGGGLAAVIALLFIFQFNNFLGNIEDEFGQTAPPLFDVITYIPFLTVAGGAVAIVGGVMATQQSSS